MKMKRGLINGLILSAALCAMMPSFPAHAIEETRELALLEGVIAATGLPLATEADLKAFQSELSSVVQKYYESYPLEQWRDPKVIQLNLERLRNAAELMGVSTTNFEQEASEMRGKLEKLVEKYHGMNLTSKSGKDRELFQNDLGEALSSILASIHPSTGTQFDSRCAAATIGVFALRVGFSCFFLSMFTGLVTKDATAINSKLQKGFLTGLVVGGIARYVFRGDLCGVRRYTPPNFQESSPAWTPIEGEGPQQKKEENILPWDENGAK